MHRIFPILTGFVLASLVAAMVLGYLVEVEPKQENAAPTWNEWHRLHFLTGLGAALLVMFVSGIVMTYFIGTSRWCREVVETYSLDRDLLRRSTALKRRTFPITLAVMLASVTLAALGAAADTRVKPLFGNGGLSWREIHLIAAYLVTAFIVYASFVQWANIRGNQEVIAAIMSRVGEVRREKGLE